MKKLIYLANLRLPTEKAYGIQIAKMCEAFANSGHEVKLLYPYRKNPAINQDVFSYYSIKNNFVAQVVESKDYYFPGFLDKISFLVKNYFSAKALADEALKEGADIYYTRDELVAHLLSKKDKNVIFEAHRFSPKRKFFYSRFKKKEVKVVAISDGLKKDLVKFGIKDSNILVARDGVDLNEFNIEMSKETARKRLGLPLDKKIVMYAGHLFEWKGASILQKTARQLLDILFVFVGGTEYDIHNFRLKYGDKENIKIIGFKPHNEIPVYLKATDVLVLPNSAKEEISRSYTSPLKLFEYMASGRPIVVSDLPALREVLNENNAVFVKPDDPDSLAEGIKKILNKNELGDKISQKAKSDVEDYTWQKRAEKILGFICQP